MTVNNDICCTTVVSDETQRVYRIYRQGGTRISVIRKPSTRVSDRTVHRTLVDLNAFGPIRAPDRLPDFLPPHAHCDVEGNYARLYYKIPAPYEEVIPPTLEDQGIWEQDQRVLPEYTNFPSDDDLFCHEVLEVDLECTETLEVDGEVVAATGEGQLVEDLTRFEIPTPDIGTRTDPQAATLFTADPGLALRMIQCNEQLREQYEKDKDGCAQVEQYLKTPEHSPTTVSEPLLFENCDTLAGKASPIPIVQTDDDPFNLYELLDSFQPPMPPIQLQASSADEEYKPLPKTQDEVRKNMPGQKFVDEFFTKTRRDMLRFRPY